MVIRYNSQRDDYIPEARADGTGLGFVDESREINTTPPLQGGGDLSADRTISLGTQSANTVLAGATSGGATAPNFRALVVADIPNDLTTVKIGDDQVTNAKLANMAQATIKGRAAAAGTGDPTDLSAAQVATIVNAAIDHGSLAGLGDDDHPQYATNAEFDDHNARHESGGADPIQLDNLAAPDDNTDLDASTSKHGLLRKLDNDTTHFLRGDGSWAVPPGAYLVGLDNDEVSGSAATTISFSGLANLVIGEMWILHVAIENPTGGAVDYYLEFNGDTTAGNYHSQGLQAASTTVSGNRVNTPLICVISAGDRANIEIHVMRDEEGRTRSTVWGVREDSANVTLRYQGHVWNTTNTPTQIDLVSATASAFGIGTRTELYKLARAA